MNTGKKISVLALVMMLLMTASVSAFASTQTTYASVAFKEGELSWDDNFPAGTQGMNFNFGLNELPAGAVDYKGEEGEYMLRIKDSRSTNAGWYVSVGMSEFQDVETESDLKFDGVLTLSDPVVSHDEIQHGAGSPWVIASGDSGIPGMGLSESFRSVFSITWMGTNVVLSIGEEEAQSIMNASYKAEITWTMTSGV